MRDLAVRIGSNLFPIAKYSFAKSQITRAPTWTISSRILCVDHSQTWRGIDKPNRFIFFISMHNMSIALGTFKPDSDIHVQQGNLVLRFVQ